MKHSFVRSLRNSGIEVMTASDANKLGYSDEEQLIWATQQNRVIYSFNIGDFCRLHSVYMLEGRNHAGIVLGQQSYSVGALLRGIKKLMAAMSAEDMRNQLVFLSAYIRDAD